MPHPTVLLVCSSPPVIDSVRRIPGVLSSTRLAVCANLDDAFRRLGSENVVLVLAHLAALGEEEGPAQLLRQVAKTRRPCATVVLADSYQEEQADWLFRAGIADYVQLPVDHSKLAHLLYALTCRFQTTEVNGFPTASVEPAPVGTGATPVRSDESTDVDGLKGLMQQVTRVAPQDTTLLLTGETGTGKTRLARLIHEMSPRRDLPFLVVDCGCLAPALIESELFGHVKGAFTGADRERAGKLTAAENGTILLDEINSLPLPLQSKLLRAVDARVFEPVGSNREQPLRARLIVATNVPLDQEVAAGRFRPDLYHRLNVVGFFLPPLRERRAAIAPLAERFLAEFCARNRPDVKGFAAGTLAALQRHDWPGNVRELRNVVEGAVALCDGPEVKASDLPESIRCVEPVWDPATSLHDVPDNSLVTLRQSKQEAEVRRILEALQKHNNNRLRAAAELGISRVGLYKKLHMYGIMHPDSAGVGVHPLYRRSGNSR